MSEYNIFVVWPVAASAASSENVLGLDGKIDKRHRACRDGWSNASSLPAISLHRSAGQDAQEGIWVEITVSDFPLCAIVRERLLSIVVDHLMPSGKGDSPSR